MTVIELLKNIDSNNELVYSIIRTIIIYVYAIFLIRIGNQRMQLQSSMDFILIIILGGVLIKPIYGEGSLLITLVISFTLVFLHAFLAKISYYSKTLDRIIKGKPIILIKNGKLQFDIMKKNAISYEDLIEACRKELKHDNLKEIKEASLERAGFISFKT